MIQTKLSILAVISAITLGACNAKASVPIENYGSTDAVWLVKLHELNQGKNIKFRVVQIGDSHTAGDFFSDELRTRLQQRWGNGGIGWVAPASVAGQRNATVKQKGSGWQVLSSRKDQAEFPLGGVLARAGGFASMSIIPNKESADEQEITFIARPILTAAPLTVIDGNGKRSQLQSQEGNFGWQYLTVSGSLPFSYENGGDGAWEVGQINIENKQRGIIWSAMGINGSQLSQWNRWRSAWTQDLAATKADLVVLAYGTNEAFNNTIDVAETQQQWLQTITQIRATLPNAGILIIGAPESLKAKTGDCGQRPLKLSEIQMMQQQVAQQSRAMFWSWQNAMGGECTMKNWVAQGLGAKDGVHFNGAGYRQAADVLADALIELANK